MFKQSGNEPHACTDTIEAYALPCLKKKKNFNPFDSFDSLTWPPRSPKL